MYVSSTHRVTIKKVKTKRLIKPDLTIKIGWMISIEIDAVNSIIPSINITGFRFFKYNFKILNAKKYQKRIKMFSVCNAISLKNRYFRIKPIITNEIKLE